MNEYINLTLENIDSEHLCCAIGDKKHQNGVDSKKEWIKSKLKDMIKRIEKLVNIQDLLYIEPKNKIEIYQDKRNNNLYIEDSNYIKEQKQRDDYEPEI